MCRGHANLLCIVPILTDDPRRESIWVLARGGYTWRGKASCAQCAGSAGAGMSTMWRFFRKNAFPLPEGASYLLGLLAMIKCSICSYQCDNWYSSNRKIACHANFSLGRSFLELARGHLACCPGIALSQVRHTLRGNISFYMAMETQCSWSACGWISNQQAQKVHEERKVFIEFFSLLKGKQHGFSFLFKSRRDQKTESCLAYFVFFWGGGSKVQVVMAINYMTIE